MQPVSKLIILDRDGVINYNSPDYIKSAAEWQALPGSLEAIALLQQHGFKIAIATNQSGIARGLYSEATFLEMQQKLNNELAVLGAEIAKLAYCPHLPDLHCSCRKPRPGMLLAILEFFKIDPAIEQVFFVGDSRSDLEAAYAANCVPVLVRTGHGAATELALTAQHAIPVFDDLGAFAANLCGKSH